MSDVSVMYHIGEMKAFLLSFFVCLFSFLCMESVLHCIEILGNDVCACAHNAHYSWSSPPATLTMNKHRPNNKKRVMAVAKRLDKKTDAHTHMLE